MPTFKIFLPDKDPCIHYSNLKRAVKGDIKLDDDNGVITHSTLDEGYDFHITDKRKKKYLFKIVSFMVPSGLLSEAREVTKDNSCGYTLQVLADFDIEPVFAENILKAKIKKGINQRHITRHRGIWEIREGEVLRGRIDWAEDKSDTEFNRCFVIDGKRITIEDFVRMLEPFEGFNFKFEIKDPSEDID